MELDHLILAVSDAAASVAFYTGVLGLTAEADQPPFSVVRVTPALTLQLAPWGTDGGQHLAFAMDRDAFDAAFARVRGAGIAFGDSFHAVGNGRGPGREAGARGEGDAVYLFDPDRHLIEIRCYDESAT